jgi:hypothetical protein
MPRPLMLSSNLNVLMGAVGEALAPPNCPVTSVPLQRLAESMLGLILQDRRALCVHGHARQRTRFLGWLRGQAGQRLRSSSLRLFASCGTIRVVLGEALGRDRPVGRRRFATDRLVQDALADGSRIVAFDQGATPARHGIRLRASPG